MQTIDSHSKYQLVGETKVRFNVASAFSSFVQKVEKHIMSPEKTETWLYNRKTPASL